MYSGGSVVGKASTIGIEITAELGRALAVVKVTFQVNGNTQFSGVCPSNTIGAIRIKFGTNDIHRGREPTCKI